ncbi:hypothetical protein [Rickettsia prowazekii]|uniref:Uncharacterized protein n=1 Tax=Rickettsia prowazekii (strain Rp22) TaxID=449216 RepID=D5AXC7_RICPP|nr:hypothetical protein [Rickettsia prowazekii]EOB09907.1 Folylpolyglutamate synthase [Rickettsia prowazekii str. GvF12]ADE30066.1 hypothetical protein rpr22_0561 [Rickettsia prowazekii str. Rp22]AGJ01816.1 hypothetical protein H374_5310 [Rickettsia prowazekii str. NMRC Madrid E]AGJ02304.1 reductase [Rickettsia prowazekii str. Breinl]AMS12427.1 folylpolyglutamate synthase [Rickettsia prowazekii]
MSKNDEVSQVVLSDKVLKEQKLIENFVQIRDTEMMIREVFLEEFYIDNIIMV